MQTSGGGRVQDILRVASARAAPVPILGATEVEFLAKIWAQNSKFILRWSQIQSSTVEEVVSVDVGQLARVNVEGAVLGEAVGWISPVHLELPILRHKIVGVNLKI